MADTKARRYHSRRDFGYGALVWSVSAVCAATTTAAAAYGSPESFVASSVASVAVIGLLLWIWSGTCYCLVEECLVLRFGPFITRIPLDDLLSVRRSTSHQAAPALSQNRLSIRYRGESAIQTIQISPFDEEGFLEELHRQIPLLPLP